jgi:hypothetical protein
LVLLLVLLYIRSYCSHLEHRTLVKRFVSIQFLNIRQSVGLPGRRLSQSQGRYLHRTTQTQNKYWRTPISWVGFEPTITAFERAKTFQVLDRAATVINTAAVAIRYWGINSMNCSVLNLTRM